jgi:manganese-dependent inorganic pyrophosphatase
LKSITWISDFKTFMNPLFEAKSDLWDMSIEDLIKYDYKEFEVSWKKLWIWTLETVNPSYALWRKEEILKWLEKIKIDSKLDFIMISIVDIFWEKNITIVLDWIDSKVLEEVFNTKVIDNLADLKNRLSRRKQVVPNLTEYFSK